MMAVICFIFFLFLDVSMIGLCAYCYSGKENWQEGKPSRIPRYRRLPQSTERCFAGFNG